MTYSTIPTIYLICGLPIALIVIVFVAYERGRRDGRREMYLELVDRLRDEED